MAKKPPELFVPVSVRMSADRAIMIAGPMAELLYIRALAFAKVNYRHGELYAEDLPMFAHGIPKARDAANALVGAGLWDETPTGWMIRSWCKWNADSVEIAEYRETKTLAGRRGNHVRHGHPAEFEACEICQKKG